MKLFRRMLLVAFLIVVTGVLISNFGEGVVIAVFVLWVLPVLVGIKISGTKERDAPIPLAILLGWVGVLIALTLSGGGRRCPQCAETVKTQALVCRFCGHRFAGSA